MPSPDPIVGPEATGQKDRNGREIFDGDFGPCYNLVDSVGNPKKVTVFRKRKGWYIRTDDGWEAVLIGEGKYGIEVVGNIHDLPPS